MTEKNIWDMPEFSLPECIAEAMELAPYMARKDGLTGYPMTREMFLETMPYFDLPEDLYCLHVEHMAINTPLGFQNGPLMIVLDPAQYDLAGFVRRVTQKCEGNMLTRGAALREFKKHAN